MNMSTALLIARGQRTNLCAWSHRLPVPSLPVYRIRPGSGQVATLVEVRRPAELLRHGAIAGVVAAITLLAEEMVATTLLGGKASDPFRLVTSVVFRQPTLSPELSLWIVLLVGGAMHLVLSLLFGMFFVFLVSAMYQLSARVPLLLLYGFLYGLALWELNILTVLPLLFPRVAPLFGLANQIWNGIVAYGIFYGLVLGAYVALARPGVVADWKRSPRTRVEVVPHGR